MQNNFFFKLIAGTLLVAAPGTASAQNNTGMATGNYAGVSGLWLNPANAVDSRYKFDVNIIGINSYFSNNYLLVNNTAIVRRLFYKAPYNESFTDVKKDLLEEGTVNGKVYARTENNIQFPLSFIITTGKKSAIAVTMANRTANRLDSLNPSTAKLFYDELRNPSLYNTLMNNDSLRYNFLNWQEVGFTYGRVLVGKGNIFFKAAVTAKWLGAGAGGFIAADKLSVTFKDSNTVSLNSPLIRYGRTATADLGQFARKNIFNNIEDQSLGIDAGVVFELRAKMKKFKYVDEDEKTVLRRDLNKYIFRLGISVVDIGSFTFNRKTLTNDHSANIINWGIAGIKASNLSQFDTAYSKKISYITGVPSTFTYRLPAAAIVNFDLHLFSGFYVNIAAKRPLSGYAAKASTALVADSWTVVTPRFESKFLGIYIPVSRVNNRTNVGATIKFGPVYFGSNNLSEILANKKTYEADFHAGLRLSILHGKPSKALLKMKRLTEIDAADNNDENQNDSRQKQAAAQNRKITDSTARPVINIIIQNTDGTTQSRVVKNNNDSVVIKNEMQNLSNNNIRNVTPPVKDTTTEFLLRQLAVNQVEIKRLNEQVNGTADKSSKKEKAKKEGKPDMQDIERELASLKAQMAVQNAALIAVAATSSKKDDKNDIADSLNKNDSLIITATDTTIKAAVPEKYQKQLAIKNDTVLVHVRDTVVLEKQITASLPAYSPVYFKTGETTLSNEDAELIKKLARDLNKHRVWKVELTGRTDASGSAAINQRVAKARINAVKKILINEGVPVNRILISIALSVLTEKNVESQRRIDILLLEK